MTAHVRKDAHDVAHTLRTPLAITHSSAHRRCPSVAAWRALDGKACGTITAGDFGKFARSGLVKEDPAARREKLAAQSRAKAAEVQAETKAAAEMKGLTESRAAAAAAAAARVKAKREAEVKGWAEAKAKVALEHAPAASDLPKEERWRGAAEQLRSVPPASSEAVLALSEKLNAQLAKLHPSQVGAWHPVAPCQQHTRPGAPPSLLSPHPTRRLRARRSPSGASGAPCGTRWTTSAAAAWVTTRSANLLPALLILLLLLL